VRRLLLVVLMAVLLLASGCGGKPHASSAPADKCKASDGPTSDTVKRAIAAVPVEVPGSFWVEIGRGHTKKCRLHWVQIIPTIASESTPQQLLFFDHDTPLGPPTPNPKPYITVLPPSDDAISVRYQWQKGKDEPCCPSGSGTVKFDIGPNGKLRALGSIPNQ
jgi:LppP/LprE lipoprotein